MNVRWIYEVAPNLFIREVIAYNYRLQPLSTVWYPSTLRGNHECIKSAFPTSLGKFVKSTPQGNRVSWIVQSLRKRILLPSFSYNRIVVSFPWQSADLQFFGSYKCLWDVQQPARAIHHRTSTEILTPIFVRRPHLASRSSKSILWLSYSSTLPLYMFLNVYHS